MRQFTQPVWLAKRTWLGRDVMSANGSKHIPIEPPNVRL
jgi:hypothetical protein